MCYLVSCELKSLAFWFWPLFNSMKWLYYKKGHKPNNFESHNPLKLSFPILTVFLWILLNVSLSLNQTLLTFWHSMGEKLGWQNWFWQFLCGAFSFFHLNRFCYSYPWSCSLCEVRNSFYMELTSIKVCVFLFMFSTGITLFSVLLLFPQSNTFVVFMHDFSSYFV